MLEDGADVWCEAAAAPENEGYRILSIAGFDPEFERPEFLPEALVRCEMKTLANGPVLLAVGLARSPG